jgi:site-specific DNA-methyltransferase (adenine-specific)
MKTLEDNHFDLIITDPPYSINIAKNGIVGISNSVKAKEYDKCDWDSDIPSEDIFKEMFRVSKNQIIFGGNYMTEYLKPTSSWIVWDKKNDKSFFADCELAWTSFNKAIRIFRHRWFGMLQEEMGLHKEKRFHPTQKPVALGRWILEKFAVKGDKIFDPFAGSGSFLVACQQKGFDFIGCEKEEKYCKIIEERLNQKGLGDWFK